MLLRICLILAIVAGVAVIGVAHFKLRPQVQGIITEREYNLTQWKDFEGKFKKSQRDLKTTQETLQKTEGELEDTKTQLVAANNKANEQQKRADALKTTLDATKSELTDAQREIAAWKALGRPVEQIASIIQSEKSMREANTALELEKQVLAKVIAQQGEVIDKLLGPNKVQPLPSGLRGRVVAVDPKWDFVVVDVGRNEGAKVNGELVVCRDSKLVGKVRITDVQDNRSIANILPGWKVDEVNEGDIVFPR